MKWHEIEEALSFEILDSKGLLNIFCGVVLDDVFLDALASLRPIVEID